jgi:hypothetical protein
MSNNQGRSTTDHMSDVWSPLNSADEPPPLPGSPELSIAIDDEMAASAFIDVSLAESLVQKGYHPVMLFGTAASGKSSMLASLFHYLQTDPWSEAICLLGEWILPIETNEGASVAEEASRFYNHVVMNFNRGQAAPSTRNEVPFFIPVVLRPNNGKPDIKIAFLESRGEDYKIKAETIEYFPKLKNEILDVYRHYPDPISLLIISPYTLKDAYSEEEIERPGDAQFNEVDQSLYGALQSYQKDRQWPERDNYLFVLTKWDVHTGGLGNPEFANPPAGLVEKLIKERYPLAWNLYRNMPKGGNSNSMQYSSGLMNGDGVVTVPDRFRPSINKFPRALWNWLYINASGGTALYGPKKTDKSTGLFGWLKKALS